MAVLKYWDPNTGQYVPLTVGITGGSGGGSGILSGIGPPDASVGTEGDFYLDSLNHILYGPKTSGVWPVAIAGGVAKLRFTFATASTTWTIDHNLGSKTVEVNCFDLAEVNEYDPEVDYPTDNQVIVRWYYPTSGVATIIG